MSTPIADDHAFLTACDQALAELTADAPAWLRDFRRDGSRRARELGFPTVRDEEWKYTNVGPAVNGAYRLPAVRTLAATDPLADFVGDAAVRIVFVNGHFAPELTDLGPLQQGVTVRSLADGLRDSAEATRERVASPNGDAGDVFAALNDAFVADGALISVAENFACDLPIHVVYVASEGDDQSMSFPRTAIHLGRGSAASIVESYVSFTELTGFTSAITDIVIEDNARLDLCRIQEENLKSFHFGTTRVVQGRDSRLESFSFAAGARISRHSLSAAIAGEGAEAILNGLYVGRADQVLDNHVFVDHQRPNGHSDQLYKGLLDDKSRGVFSGKIVVRQAAQLTNAYQLNQNLLMSGQSKADMQPQLEISADDVKCSHGATVGQVNSDEIFYCRTRAISEAQARAMLARGFVYDVLAKVSRPDVRARLAERLNRRFANAAGSADA